MKTKLIGAALILSLAPLVSAEEAAAPGAAEKCFSADTLVKHVKKMSSLKPKRMDTLHSVMDAGWVRRHGDDPYPKVWTRADGVDTPLSVDDKGIIPDFSARLSSLSKGAELCAPESQDQDNPNFEMSIGTAILFQNETGPFSIAELQDGVGDGKSFYKKMMPGPMALLVPKMTHVSVQYEDKMLPLNVRFTQAGAAVDAPPYEMSGSVFVFSLEDIEASGADMMHVDGGPFRLTPTPSIEKMKSLGIISDDDDDESENAGDK